jgi:hypothetical protein
MRNLGAIAFCLTVFAGDCSSPWSGPIDDASCDVESVEHANSMQLAGILSELVNTSFFRLLSIDVSSNQCPFWSVDDEESCGATVEVQAPFQSMGSSPEPASACSLAPVSSSVSDIPWTPTTDDIDMTLTEREEIQTSQLNNDPNMDLFWMDLLSNIWANSSTYVNLQLNPERWTGYNGSSVWQAMYTENCFSRIGVSNEELLCYEERVMYRLLSGMHSATNVLINLEYYPPRRGVRKTWEPNPERFAAQYNGKQRFIQNMHFAFVVLLRAARKATPLLYDYSAVALKDDPRAIGLLKRLLDAQIMRSCSPVFDAFDESLLFQDEFHNLTTLKKQFKGVFKNISSVLDCVTCAKCKLHAKVTLLGLGSALKILLMPDHLVRASLRDHEVVALINTLHKFSSAIEGVQTLTKLLQKKKTSAFPICGKRRRRILCHVFVSF